MVAREILQDLGGGLRRGDEHRQVPHLPGLGKGLRRREEKRMVRGMRNALVKWDSFSRELGRAQTLTEVKNLADKAKAVEVYCRNAKIGLPEVNKAITWWVRSARKAGGLLAKVERSPGGDVGGRSRPKNSSFHAKTSYQKTLNEVGLHRLMALRWQYLAKIPEKKFESFLAKFKAELELLSMALLMKLLPVEAAADPPPLPAGKFRIIYADPPWQYGDKLIEGIGRCE